MTGFADRRMGDLSYFSRVFVPLCDLCSKLDEKSSMKQRKGGQRNGRNGKKEKRKEGQRQKKEGTLGRWGN